MPRGEFGGGLLMSLSRESIAGIISIVTVVAAAVWYARDPEMPNWPSTATPASGASRFRLPEISVGQLDWSADGRTLLTRTRGIGEREDLLTLHPLTADRQPIPLDATGRGCSAAALAADGRHVLMGTWSGELWWIDAESSAATTLVELPGDRSVTAVALQEKPGGLAAAGTSVGAILLCDMARHTVSELPSDHSSSTCCLRFSRGGGHLASSHADGSVAVWDLLSGKRLQIL